MAASLKNWSAQFWSSATPNAAAAADLTSEIEHATGLEKCVLFALHVFNIEPLSPHFSAIQALHFILCWYAELN